jgi:hypothetical protein
MQLKRMAHRPFLRREAVHFWTLRELPGLDNWQPDEQPQRFPTGYGHHFLELYVRLCGRGLPVSIGSRPRGRPRLLVCSLEELASFKTGIQPDVARRLAAAAVVKCPQVLVVRGDLPLWIEVPRFVRIEILPNASSIRDSSLQRWLPLLPQRGLIPRKPARMGQVSDVSMKVYEHNVPPFARDPAFVGALDRLGVNFSIDTEIEGATRWHDFSDVDVIICARRFRSQLDDQPHSRKPATKLINAWVAGVIPLVAPEASYLELIHPGHDALTVASTEEIVAALEALRSDPGLVKHLEEGVARRGREFAAGQVLSAWEELLWSDLGRSSRLRASISYLAYAAAGVRTRFAARSARHRRPERA